MKVFLRFAVVLNITPHYPSPSLSLIDFPTVSNAFVAVPHKVSHKTLFTWKHLADLAMLLATMQNMSLTQNPQCEKKTDKFAETCKSVFSIYLNPFNHFFSSCLGSFTPKLPLIAPYGSQVSMP